MTYLLMLFLMADPAVTWTPSDETRVRAWLQDLEMVRLVELDTAPVQHVTHLLRGLKRIEANAGRLR